MFKRSLKGLLVCLAAISITNADYTDLDDGRIAKGQAITIDNAPYLMQLRYSPLSGQFCGATLVKPRYVVTAAHCLTDVNITRINVVGGATYTSDPGVNRKVMKIFVHPKYNNATYWDYDIAVLKLESDMSGKNISDISLCSKQLMENAELTVSGWGMDRENGIYPQKLFTITVPTISRETCREDYSFKKISDSMICATRRDGMDTCTGDSGGSAVHRGELCGVVSWGRGCGRSNYPGVYTSIAATRDFLDYALTQ